jgi:hypothetical protein
VKSDTPGKKVEEKGTWSSQLPSIAGQGPIPTFPGKRVCSWFDMLERDNKGQSKTGQSMLANATTLRATRQQKAFISKTKTVRCD